jgi:hypothetical protein
VSFWAFDLLWIDGEPLLDRPYLERRQRLEELRLTGPCGVLPCFPGPDAAGPGERTRHWRKLKTPDWSAVHRPRRGPQDPPPE